MHDPNNTWAGLTITLTAACEAVGLPAWSLLLKLLALLRSKVNNQL